MPGARSRNRPKRYASDAIISLLSSEKSWVEAPIRLPRLDQLLFPSLFPEGQGCSDKRARKRFDPELTRFAATASIHASLTSRPLSQAVRQRIANPPSPVRIREGPCPLRAVTAASLTSRAPQAEQASKYYAKQSEPAVPGTTACHGEKTRYWWNGSVVVI